MTTDDWTDRTICVSSVCPWQQMNRSFFLILWPVTCDTTFLFEPTVFYWWHLKSGNLFIDCTWSWFNGDNKGVHETIAVVAARNMKKMSEGLKKEDSDIGNRTRGKHVRDAYVTNYTISEFTFLFSFLYFIHCTQNTQIFLLNLI